MLTLVCFTFRNSFLSFCIKFKSLRKMTGRVNANEYNVYDDRLKFRMIVNTHI